MNNWLLNRVLVAELDQDNDICCFPLAVCSFAISFNW